MKSEKLAEILIEGKDSISRKDLLKYFKSNFEGLSLRNRKTLHENISPIQNEILKLVKDNSYLGNEVKM